MITKYYRPQTLDEALKLISRPDTLPLGGGTLLAQPRPEAVAVVDLQALGLNTLQKRGKDLAIGATVTLQTLLESADTPAALKSALKLEAPLNIRNAGTAAGALVAADGRSTFATVMLALDTKLTLLPAEGEVLLGNFFPLRGDALRGKLITKITVPLNTKLTLEHVSRTPADKPIVCAALTQWPSGRTRLALGGYGKSPLLAMDGTEPGGLEEAARNAFHEAADEWASAEYRMDVAARLAKRCFERL